MKAQHRTRFHIVANPASGRRRGARMADAVHRLLRRAGADATLEFTSARGDAESIARAALQGTAAQSGQQLCVVACGGDGTVQEVVNAMLAYPPARPPAPVLGVIPGGRCNDFAAAFGIRRDADQVARTLLSGRVRSVDLGRVNQRYFCTIAALGFDAAVARYVNNTKLPFAGTPAYVYGVLRVLLSYQPVMAKLAFDGADYEGPLFLAASANTPTYGGKMRIAPDASAHDGLLDVCLVSQMSRLRVMGLLRRVLSGRHTDLPEIRMIRTRTLAVDTLDRQELWADGEFVGHTPATIDVVPAALDMIVPAALDASR